MQLTTNNQSVTVTSIFNAIISLNATITDFCTNPITISKTINIAGRTPSLNTMTIQRNGPSCLAYDFQPLSFGIVDSSGATGCSLYSLGIVEVDWQFYYFGTGTANITYNEGYYACVNPNGVINAGISIGFGNFSNPYVVTLRFRVKNKCGLWSSFSAGFSFQIKRC